MTATWPPGLTLRPIAQWPGNPTRPAARRRSNFSAPWASTLDTLDRELHYLTATTRVLQIAMREQDFRIDGMPRAQAKAEHPGVILSFHAPAHGDLSYPCDRFTTWQDNLRAIALALEALRKVDRYGVTRRGEQYRGWKAIEGGQPIVAGAALTELDAYEVIARFAEAHQHELVPGGSHHDTLGIAVRRAQRRTHPDHGGRSEDFQQVQAAVERLRAAGDLS